MSLINRKWLLKRLFNSIIQQTKKPITVRGLKNREHVSSKYLTVSLYIQGAKFDDEIAVAYIKRDIHLVDDLRAKMLINADIIESEEMTSDLQADKLIIGNCDMIAPLICRPFRNYRRVNRTASIQHAIIISTHTVVEMPFRFKNLSKLSTERNFFFQSSSAFSQLDEENDVMTHVLDVKIIFVHVRNAIDKSILLSKHIKLGRIINFEKEGCYAADIIDAHLIIEINWKKRAFIATVEVVMTAAFMLVHITFNSVNEAVTEVVITENIIIYDISLVQQRLLVVIDVYSTIWKKSDTVHVSESEWMSIDTIFDAKTESFKIYFVSSQDREIINKEFDKLHEQGKLRWIIEIILYDFSVFVVWRTIHTSEELIRKGRVIIDIRDFNKVIVSDDYSMFLQIDIINLINDCLYISVMNRASYFHQWLVKIIDRYKFIIVSHRDSEQWNVTLMSFRNNPAYVQRQIDRLLREYREFVRTYMNDIVIFNKTFDEHLSHLDIIFQLFKRMNIVIKSIKTYLNYSSIALLDQKMNSLGFITIEEKLKAIFKLQFSNSLKLLKFYLDLIGWMRNYVFYYAQLSNSLQARKTLMLRELLIKGNVRKRFSAGSRLNIFINVERLFYETFQKMFNKFTFLIHHDFARQLYADVDVLHERDFGVTVYHVKKEKITYSKKDIELILFLSKVLISAEFRYWLIELKTADLIWLMKRVRHMIEAVRSTS